LPARFVLTIEEDAPPSVKVAAALSEVDAADIRDRAVDARTTAPLIDTGETLRGSVIHVIWITTTHHRATSSLNSTRHSRIWVLTLMRLTRRSSISKGGTRTNKPVTSYDHYRMQASSPIRMHTKITSWTSWITTTKPTLPNFWWRMIHDRWSQRQ